MTGDTFGLLLCAFCIFIGGPTLVAVYLEDRKAQRQIKESWRIIQRYKESQNDPQI